MRTDGCVGPKSTRLRVPATKLTGARMSHRQRLGLARLEGPEHLHPPDFNDHIRVPWYVQTHTFRRTGGHWNCPRYHISLYEVTNVLSGHRKLPVLRRVKWDHERDFTNVKQRGLFDPSVFEEAIARMTTADALEFDHLCQNMLDSLPALEPKHSPVMPATYQPKSFPYSLATSEYLRFTGDSFEVTWESDLHISVDQEFNEIWSFMDAICSDKKRHLDGWTDGYRKAPDAEARAWAKSLRG